MALRRRIVLTGVSDNMSKQATLQFLGAAGTVTGSKHLLSVGADRVLLDCGLFQGQKALRLRNWEPSPFEAAELNAVVLSHGHIDHSGGLPRLVREGFGGPIHCTPATADLLSVMLPDAAYLQEEQAAHANRFRYSKHRPALPLYTMEDAYAALELLTTQPYGDSVAITSAVSATLRPAGHILGSASVDLGIEAGGKRRLTFSGDIGRWGRPILRDPQPVPEADVVVMESTYGDRNHPPAPQEELAAAVRHTAARGAALLVPAFAVGRTQELLWTLRSLEERNEIPELPVYVDSPMAIDVTGIYLNHPEEYDDDMRRLVTENSHPLAPRNLTIARTVEQSKSLNDLKGPVIIISASGMATGGRILHHLKRWLPERRATVLLIGFQAAGTRGRALQDGSDRVKIHGQEVAVRAEVVTIRGLSAHGDRDELLRWLGEFSRAPRRIYLVHGEPAVSEAFADVVRERGDWKVEVAQDGATVTI